MRSILSTMACWLATGFAFAQEGTANSGPPETVSTIYVILFVLGFIGMIVGFLAYLWWGGRNEKSEE